MAIDKIMELNSYDLRTFEDCSQKAGALRTRLLELKEKVGQHSKTFDTAAWNQGSRYSDHPIDLSGFSWE